MSDQTPTTLTFSGFDLLADVGTTAYGKVFQAQQRNPLRRVRLLIIEPSVTARAGYVTALVLRAKTAATIKHTCLPEVYDAAMGDGLYYLSTEWIEGLSVADWLASAGPVPVQSALELGLACANALKVAWNQAQLPHGDISLANIVIQADGIVKLMDLALAKIGDANRLADVAALGAALHQMMVGTPPPADSGHVPPGLRLARPELHERVSRVLERMLTVDLARAYPDYDQLGDDLAAVFGGNEPPHTPPRLTLTLAEHESEPPAAAPPQPAPASSLSAAPSSSALAGAVPHAQVKVAAPAPTSGLKRIVRPVVALVVVAIVWFLVDWFKWSKAPPPPPPPRSAAPTQPKRDLKPESPALPSWLVAQSAPAPTNAPAAATTSNAPSAAARTTPAPAPAAPKAGASPSRR